MLIWALVVIFFWAVVPGLITGWMMRERGRSFWPGLFLGAVCGPLGILGTLAFIYFSDRRRMRERRNVRGRAVRVFYEIPVVGRLHVSTVWALAGLATFLCLWMIGGITYELYRAGAGTQETAEQTRESEAGMKGEGAQQQQAGPGVRQQAAGSQRGADTRQGEQANASTQARSALVGNLAPSAGQAQPSGARPDNSSALWQSAQPAPGGPVLPAQQQPTASVGPVLPPAPPAPPAPSPGRGSAQSRADAVAEVTRDLASRGYRVHAALSGDAQTTTLSLTGATLTRAAGNQLLGNGRLRGALKGAGVHIVVLVNGEESWTYIL